MSTPSTEGSVRVDKWLWAARCFKTRSQATKACADGLVQVNGEEVKASAKVKVGDQVRAVCPGRRKRTLEVIGLAEKRGPAAAAELLFVDHTPPPPPKSEYRDEPGAGMEVDRGQGRPSKRDRRRYNALKGW